MTLPWLIASLHLVALALGVAAVLLRARSLGRVRDTTGLSAVFVADNLWGFAAILWLVTGLWRAFGSLEKGTAYYLGHPLFQAKLGLFIVVVLLEVWPAMTLVRWRRARSRGTSIDFATVDALARISYVQLAIVLAMVFLATAIARGMWI